MTGCYIPIINGSEAAKVKVSDVLMVERDRRRLHVVTETKDYFYYEKLENIEPLLGRGFYPCLKGCYINFSKVSYMSDQMICFNNGHIYNLGRANFIRTRQMYKDYLKNIV